MRPVTTTAHARYGPGDQFWWICILSADCNEFNRNCVKFNRIRQAAEPTWQWGQLQQKIEDVSFDKVMPQKYVSGLGSPFRIVDIWWVELETSDMRKKLDGVHAFNLVLLVCRKLFPVQAALCGLRGCKNWPAPFPGRMSYKATKPGLVSVLYLSMRCMVLLFIRAPFYVLLVFIAIYTSLFHHKW